MTRGTPLVAVAAFAVGLVVGILLGGSMGSVSAPDPRPGDPGAAPAPPPLPDRVPPADPESPSSPESETPSPAASADPAATCFVVTVTNADGSPADASVYAIPAGEPGGERGELPRAFHRPPGPAVLPVPRPGVYDVGARGSQPYVAGLLTDRRAEAGKTTKLALQLPDAAPIHIETSGPWPDMKALGVRVEVYVRSVDEDAVHFPGRNEKLRFGIGWGNLPPDGKLLVKGVPLDLTYRVTTRVVSDKSGANRPSSAFAVIAEPAVVRAGDTVRLRTVPAGCLEVKVRLADWDAWPERQPIRLRFRMKQERFEWSDDHSFKDRNALYDAEKTPRFAGPPGPAVLSWTGRGIRPGSITGIELGTGTTVTREIHIEPETATPPEPLIVTLHGFPTSFNPEEDDWIDLDALGGEGSGVAFSEITEKDAVTLPGEWRLGRWLLGFHGRALASAPVAIPAAGGVTVPLRSAGVLIVVPEPATGFPEEFGELRLRRKDGLPFLSNTDYGQVDQLSFDHKVETGDILGPFPAGEYVFTVHLGRAPLPDAKATVREGRMEVLRIRR